MTITDPIELADTALHAALRQINEEISTYPGPIAGCDAQFNYLLDCRRRLERARSELAAPTLQRPA